MHSNPGQIRRSDGAGVQNDEVLTVLSQVSLAALEQTCRAAVRDAKPFTHVHLLAHGYPVGYAHRQRFGMAFHSATGDLAEVTPEQVEDALKPLVGHAVVVTLATCDAANLTNTDDLATQHRPQSPRIGIPDRRGIAAPVDQGRLHAIGVDLLRRAAGRHRCAGGIARDAPGLVPDPAANGARLGEPGRLRAPAGRLCGSPAGHQARCGAGGAEDRYKVAPTDWSRASAGIRPASIRSQTWCRRASRDSKPSSMNPGRPAGAACSKRIWACSAVPRNAWASSCFVRSGLGESDRWRQAMREALERARGWYLRASEHNLSHHWTAAQYLSLEAALTGSIANCGLWHAAVTSAQIDRRRPRPMDVIWALGSLLELYLLAPLARPECRAPRRRKRCGPRCSRPSPQWISPTRFQSNRRNASCAATSVGGRRRTASSPAARTSRWKQRGCWGHDSGNSAEHDWWTRRWRALLVPSCQTRLLELRANCSEVPCGKFSPDTHTIRKACATMDITSLCRRQYVSWHSPSTWR